MAVAAPVSRLPIDNGQPRTPTSSLIDTGTPSSADKGRPRRQRRSEARAATRAASVSRWLNALISGLTRSVRARIAVSASEGEALPLAYSRDKPAALA